MADDMFQFLWDVRQTGYQWVEGRPAPDRKDDYEQYEPELFLVDAAGDTMINRYDPLQEHSGLFRRFADAPPTQDGILEFANQFGCLGGDAEEGIFLVGRGERLSIWVGQIRIMRETIDLWDLARAGDMQGLSRYIEWEGSDTVRRRPQNDAGGLIETISSWEIAPELLHQFRPGDLIQPALVSTQRRINRQMAASPRLLWNHKEGRSDLHILPNSLIGALWLQFAQAVDGDRKYRRCAECRTWFEISPETARVTRLYCSNACRSKAYRKRQLEAERLHAQGVPIEEIGRRLESDTKTVSGWIGGKSKAV